MRAMEAGEVMPPGTTREQVRGCMSIIAAIARVRRGGQPPIPVQGGGGGGGGGGTSIGGVGSTSTSETDYPRTGEVYTGDVWLDPSAATNGDGSEGSPYNSLASARAALNDGERLIVRAGTITLTSQITCNTSWATGIEVFAYGTERPVIDASGLSSTERALYFTSGANEHWKGFELVNGPHRGVNIESTDTKLEDCWVHGFARDGIYIANFGSGAGSNQVLDCMVWRLGNGTETGTNVPDGIVVTGNTGSPSENNDIVRCFVANAPDDGFDLFRGRGTRVVDCVAFEAGYYWNGNPAGDGNGFKMGGGDSDSGDNYAIGCLAVDCRASGFSHNEARNTPTESDPNIVFAFCTAHGNGGSGINTGGDQAAHLNVRRDSIITSNGSVGYVGANAVALRDVTGGVTYVDEAGRDYSLDTGSAGIDDGIEGGISNSVATQPTTGTATNAGASELALDLALDWMNRDLTA
jgi:hypothetical protein